MDYKYLKSKGKKRFFRALGIKIEVFEEYLKAMNLYYKVANSNSRRPHKYNTGVRSDVKLMIYFLRTVKKMRFSDLGDMYGVCTSMAYKAYMEVKKIFCEL